MLVQINVVAAGHSDHPVISGQSNSLQSSLSSLYHLFSSPLSAGRNRSLVWTKNGLGAMANAVVCCSRASTTLAKVPSFPGRLAPRCVKNGTRGRAAQSGRRRRRCGRKRKDRVLPRKFFESIVHAIVLSRPVVLVQPKIPSRKKMSQN